MHRAAGLCCSRCRGPHVSKSEPFRVLFAQNPEVWQDDSITVLMQIPEQEDVFLVCLPLSPLPRVSISSWHFSCRDTVKASSAASRAHTFTSTQN
jgi:hypothetical protein